MRAKVFLVSALLVLGCSHMAAQENSKEFSVGFRVGNAVLNSNLTGNSESLAEIISFLEDIRNDSTLELESITFCGSASPEGSMAINRKLSQQRSRALEEYVRKHVTLPDNIVKRTDDITAWDYLAQLVEQSDMPHKQEAVDVMRNVPEYTYDNRGRLVDSRKKHLMELQYGRTWHYMLRNFFPSVRNASIVLVTVKKKQETPPPAPVETPAPAPAVEPEQAVTPAPAPAPQPEEKKPFYMALKTNMLYDVLTVPNIGIEFYLGNNWTIGGNVMYGWWNSRSDKRYWRIYGGDIAVRKWFGRKAEEKPLTGHHLGLYGQIFTYDFEWGGKGYMGGKPGETLWESPNYAFGVEYGYSLPIARRLNIDFTLGVGYWGGKYYTYNPRDGHFVWQSTRNRHWFGPTKAEISLVWLLGRGNSNNTKGGMK